MLTYDETKTRLNAIFVDVFDDESIHLTDATTAADIDAWDSLSHITLILAVEREFGVKFKAAEVGGLEDVGAMIKLIMERAQG